MANIFKSKFTGEQIDEILQKAQDAETPITVQANPQGEPTAELDKLKVGDTIYQTPRPIDVVANPTSVGEADLTKLRVGSTVYNIPQPEAPTTVVANPSGSGSTELTKLQVGNTIYNVPKPEVPTTVVANPQGTPTGSLEKLQVGDGIYEIPIEANPNEPTIGNLDKLRVGQGVYSIPKPTAVVANPTGGGDVDLHSIQVGDVKYNIVEPETIVANPLQEPTVILSKLQVGSIVYSILPAGAPIEISTEAAMNAVLEGAQAGAIFKYVGATTALYENGALYIVEEGESTYNVVVKNSSEVNSGSLQDTYVKFDTPPTSANDYTYKSSSTLADGAVLGETQATKAYIWGMWCYVNGEYKELSGNNFTYNNAYEITLTQDSTILLCYDAD